MTAQSVHGLDIVVTFLTIISLTALLVMLEKVADPGVRWARLASFGPLHQAYGRLPAAWGPLHGVLIAAAMLWVAAVLFTSRKLRPWLFVASGACLLFLAAVWALSAISSCSYPDETAPVPELDSDPAYRRR